MTTILGLQLRTISGWCYIKCFKVSGSIGKVHYQKTPEKLPSIETYKIIRSVKKFK